MSEMNQSRVRDILGRIEQNSNQPDSLKTCFGILAIMSRDPSNKDFIATSGMNCVLKSMSNHLERVDVQEVGCDLIWSLAFNSNETKDVLASLNGTAVLVRGLKKHSKNANFMKSACGALSNICQAKKNQDGVALQGGLQPLVGAIHTHQLNGKLLPFIFDAIASLIVNNEENAKSVSSVGLIPLIISSLGRHKSAGDLVKSGCHAMAILSDVKGQASKIAFAGGVSFILSLLDLHPGHSDLHRVAAVVVLRMLQESAHIGREIVNHDGVRIMLKSLDKGGARLDTVAAVTHILFAITGPSSQSADAIEGQLWLSPEEAAAGVSEFSKFSTSMDLSKAGTLVGRGGKPGRHIASRAGSSDRDGSLLSSSTALGSGSTGGKTSALGGLVSILQQYSSRRDVARAACRLLNNLSEFTGVVDTLIDLQVAESVLCCIGLHGDSRDVMESGTAVTVALWERRKGQWGIQRAEAIKGLLNIFRKKFDDDKIVAVVVTLLAQNLTSALGDKDVEPVCADLGGASSTGGSDKTRNADAASGNKGESREFTRFAKLSSLQCEALTLAVSSLERLTQEIPSATKSAKAENSLNLVIGVHRSSGMGLVWSKQTAARVDGLLALLEALTARYKDDRMAIDDMSAKFGSLVKQLADVVSSRSLVMSKRASKLFFNLRGRPATPPSARSKDNAGGSLKARVDSRSSPEPTEGLPPSPDGDEESRKAGSPLRALVSSREETAYLRPKHPLKRQISEKALVAHQHPPAPGPSAPGMSVSAMLSQRDHQPISLLHAWPNHLERMLASQPPPLAAFTSFDGPQGIFIYFILFSSIRTYFHLLSFHFYYGLCHMLYTGAIPERMHIVYEMEKPAGINTTSKVPTPVPYSVPPGGMGPPFEHSLSFDSEFESGNLMRAVQRGDANYDLFLRGDMHTLGNCQWFYFAVANTHPAALVRLSEQGVQVPPVRARFNLMNFTKPDSLFNMGMRPVLYSCKDAQSKGAGWMRAGTDISYYCSPFLRNNSAGEGAAYYYTLSFTMEFMNASDTYLIAYCYPYTYTDYCLQINNLLRMPGANDIIRRSLLTKTLGGVNCDLLVITDFKCGADGIGPIDMSVLEESSTPGASWGGQRRPSVARAASVASSGGFGSSGSKLKPALVVSARVHPGETPASWMMSGMLDYLCSDTQGARLLRQVFVIFVVPMLNPDGVIYGNNRCSLAGVDLNRQWKTPLRNTHPTIWSLKNFISAQKRIGREVYMYIDLHGHSRKQNVFMYACDEKKARAKPQVRAFPKFLSNHNVGKKYVSFNDCSFHVRKGRESTARVVVAKDLGIQMSFTVEATFCGVNYGPLKHCHMNIGHLLEVGGALADAVLKFAMSEGMTKDLPYAHSMVPSSPKVAATATATATVQGTGLERLQSDRTRDCDSNSDLESLEMGSSGGSRLRRASSQENLRSELDMGRSVGNKGVFGNFPRGGEESASALAALNNPNGLFMGMGNIQILGGSGDRLFESAQNTTSNIGSASSSSGEISEPGLGAVPSASSSSSRPRRRRASSGSLALGGSVKPHQAGGGVGAGAGAGASGVSAAAMVLRAHSAEQTDGVVGSAGVGEVADGPDHEAHRYSLDFTGGGIIDSGVGEDGVLDLGCAEASVSDGGDDKSVVSVSSGESLSASAGLGLTGDPGVRPGRLSGRPSSHPDALHLVSSAACTSSSSSSSSSSRSSSSSSSSSRSSSSSSSSSCSSSGSSSSSSSGGDGGVQRKGQRPNRGSVEELGTESVSVPGPQHPKSTTSPTKSRRGREGSRRSKGPRDRAGGGSGSSGSSSLATELALLTRSSGGGRK
jgi:hypothetical protein